ncbi:hypothetical protein [Neolewinella persica]|uniref:hypothetical protein n=1 Tax=Neolewinella persica TaxID=70998 RepID=UPI00037F4FC8|nr:hypothetical protein [Neolewinella persica]
MKVSSPTQILLLCITLFPVLLPAQTEAERNFQQLVDAPGWQKAFQDPGTRNWQRKWFLDGLRATVDNTPDGMVFSAGPVAGDDACHGVLWTKQSFTGDLKMRYTYTRTDTRETAVNILYLQASGAYDFPADIASWRNERIIPSMRTYFNNMNALHISYAAYPKNGGMDYVRCRQYPVQKGKKFAATAVAPDYFDTGLFRPGVPYEITVVKTSEWLFFNVKGGDKEQLFSWPLPSGDKIASGRIGIRHMYTRSARYGDVAVWERG